MIDRTAPTAAPRGHADRLEAQAAAEPSLARSQAMAERADRLRGATHEAAAPWIGLPVFRN